MDPAVFGYMRVSQAEGESGLATQRRILSDHGLRDDRIFTDVASGKNMRRPSWTELRGTLRPGDTVVVPRIDRLARNLTEGLKTIQELHAQGINHPLADGGAGHRRRQPHLPSHAPHAAVLGGVGEGQHPGSDQGRRGPRGGRREDRGRPPALSSEKVQAVKSFLENGGAVSAAARTFGVSRPTVRAARDGIYAG